MYQFVRKCLVEIHSQENSLRPREEFQPWESSREEFQEKERSFSQELHSREKFQSWPELQSREEFQSSKKFQSREEFSLSSEELPQTPKKSPSQERGCPGHKNSQKKSYSQERSQDKIQKSSDEKIVAIWWRECCDVFLLSTMHNNSADTVLKCPKGSREKKYIPCPVAIIDYNNHMGGVDLMDQHLSYYSPTTRRTIKWWKKIFWRCDDISIEHLLTKLSHREFRLRLAENLVQPLLDLQANPVASDVSEKCLVGKHLCTRAVRGEGVVSVATMLWQPQRKERIQKHKTYVKSVTCSYVLALVLKCFIHVLPTEGSCFI